MKLRTLACAALLSACAEPVDPSPRLTDHVQLFIDAVRFSLTHYPLKYTSGTDSDGKWLRASDGRVDLKCGIGPANQQYCEHTQVDPVRKDRMTVAGDTAGFQLEDAEALLSRNRQDLRTVRDTLSDVRQMMVRKCKSTHAGGVDICTP